MPSTAASALPAGGWPPGSRTWVQNKESDPNTNTGYQPNLKSCLNIKVVDRRGGAGGGAVTAGAVRRVDAAALGRVQDVVHGRDRAWRPGRKTYV